VWRTSLNPLQLSLKRSQADIAGSFEVVFTSTPRDIPHTPAAAVAAFKPGLLHPAGSPSREFRARFKTEDLPASSECLEAMFKTDSVLRKNDGLTEGFYHGMMLI